MAQGSAIPSPAGAPFRPSFAVAPASSPAVAAFCLVTNSSFTDICKEVTAVITAQGEYMVTVIWDTWLKAGTEEEGLRLTRQVWSDMKSFEGYVSHQIFVDEDAPGHVVALSKWQSRKDADGVRGKYKDSETIRRLTPLLARPRERWVTHEESASAA